MTEIRNVEADLVRFRVRLAVVALGVVAAFGLIILVIGARGWYAAWQKEQHAMKTGDERNMPIQHAGPIRRFARDYLDARSGIGVGFMPLAVVLLITIVIQGLNVNLFIVVTIVIYALFILMVIDSAWATHNARVLCEYKFGDGKVPPRFTWQMFTRTFYLRRWRLPVPMVKRGEYPV